MLNKLWWAILIPIVLDIQYLFSYLFLFKTDYIGNADIFQIKLGFISSPPSLAFFFNDFYNTFFSYNDNLGHQGLLNRSLDLLFLFQLLSMVLLVSLLKSFYFCYLNEVKEDSKFSLKHILSLTNKHWHKFLFLESIGILAVLYSTSVFFFYAIISIIFLYVEYSIVVDDLSLLGALKQSVKVLFSNFWRTIFLGIKLGLLMSLFSFIILEIGRQGVFGVFAAIVITAFLGMISNKVVMEVYRGFSQKIKEA